MKRIKTFIEYSLTEGINSLRPMSIEEFLEEIRIPAVKRDKISEWWNEFRKGIKIYYFPFNSPQPIGGCFFGEDSVCINSKLPSPPHSKLFICLHESKHCDQYAENDFMDDYYQTVVDGDIDSFLEAYPRIEKEANDFAISSMKEMGFEEEMRREERMLRGNEYAGSMVYSMMSRDIERMGPSDFFDLLSKQIF